MFRQSLLFVLAVFCLNQISAKPRENYCDECVHYSFESEHNGLFSNSEGLCIGLEPWVEGKYSSIYVEGPNDYTDSFVSPQADLSCITSFPFSMTGGGTIRANVYIQHFNSDLLDQVQVLAEEIVPGGTQNRTMGIGVRTSTDSNFQNGWQTLTFSLFGSDTVQGHIIFVGISNPRSTVLVDAFCYSPPGYDGDCFAKESTGITETTPEIDSTTEDESTSDGTDTTSEGDYTTPGATDSTPDGDSTSDGTDTTSDGNWTTAGATGSTSGATDSTSDGESSSDATDTTSDGNWTTPGATGSTSGATDSTSDGESSSDATDTTSDGNWTTPGATGSTSGGDFTSFSTAASSPVTKPTVRPTSLSTASSSTPSIPTVTVPITTISTQPPLSENGCPLNPFIHWLLPHEYDCNLFYYCVWGEKVLRNCDHGLHFNPAIQVCDWPWGAGCTLPGSP